MRINIITNRPSKRRMRLNIRYIQTIPLSTQTNRDIYNGAIIAETAYQTRKGEETHSNGTVKANASITPLVIRVPSVLASAMSPRIRENPKKERKL
jgi:hypothetical protein